MSGKLKFAGLPPLEPFAGRVPWDALSPEELHAAEVAAAEVYDQWDPKLYAANGQSPFLYLAYAINTATAGAVARIRSAQRIAQNNKRPPREIDDEEDE